MAREYKDSGIEWIGQIPKEWGIGKVKNYYSLQTGFTPDTKNELYYDDNGALWVNISDMGDSHYISNTKKKISDYYISKFKPPIVPKGSLLYSFKLSVGTVAIAGEEMYTNEAIAAFLQKDGINLSFLYYSSQVCIIFNANENIYGAKLLNQDLINNATIIFPPLAEQQKIADYLDKVCGEVDEMVALQETMIEELKDYKQSVITEAVTKGLNPDVPMRNSGIDWIGEIPEHWELGRLKHVCKINGRIGFRGYTSEDLVSEGEGAYTIGGKHISRNVIDLSNPDYLSWDKYYESPEIMVKKGDMVIAQRGTLGRVALIREEIGPATINPSLVLLNNISNNAVYLYWWLCSSSISVKIDLLNTSTAVPMISQKQIENLELLLPPLAEQRAIATYLDTKCSEIDSLIALKQAKIEELKEYKKSVIYEYVTGKKEVV